MAQEQNVDDDNSRFDWTEYDVKTAQTLQKFPSSAGGSPQTNKTMNSKQLPRIFSTKMQGAEKASAAPVSGRSQTSQAFRMNFQSGFGKNLRDRMKSKQSHLSAEFQENANSIIGLKSHAVIKTPNPHNTFNEDFSKTTCSPIIKNANNRNIAQSTFKLQVHGLQIGIPATDSNDMSQFTQQDPQNLLHPVAESCNEEEEKNGHSTFISNNENQVQGEDNNRINNNFYFRSNSINEEHFQDEIFFKLKSGKIQKYKFKFLAFLIQDSINIINKNAELRVTLAFLHCSRLNNKFKAIFELMKCEQMEPSIQLQFNIFRMKVSIEQGLIKINDQNQLNQSNIDAIQIYNYERMFQKYSLYEYVTANATLGFWREIQSKNINAHTIQNRGAQISRNYQKIQDIATELTAIYPNDIKFLHRYGMFLKQIVNNEYEAIVNFEKICVLYQARVAKGRRQSFEVNAEDGEGNNNAGSEKQIFGENSGAAIILISATTQEIGMITHVNSEIYNLLGYQINELIGKKIDIILPKPIAMTHDKLIQRYFDSAKSKVINQINSNFAVTKSGYLQHIILLIKVYPSIRSKITFVGFIQNGHKFHGIEPPIKEGLEHRDQHYIITDNDGVIMNVSEGLNFEIGLNSKFFGNSNSFQFRLDLSMFCPDISEPDIQEQMELGGTQLTFNTSNILELVELEQLSSEEILLVKAQIGIYHTYMQLRRFFYGDICSFLMFRIFILDRIETDQLTSMGSIMKFHQGTFTDLFGGTNSMMINNHISNHNNNNAVDGDVPHSPNGGDAQMVDAQDDDAMDLSSLSSAQSSLNSFNKTIQDFKKALSERTTPKNLVYLNRAIIAIVIASLILSIIEYTFMQDLILIFQQGGLHALMVQTRCIYFIQLASNIRSYINLANNLEGVIYNDSDFEDLDRISYLEHLIQNQADELQEIQDFITKERIDEDTNDEDSLINFEFKNIQLYRLDINNKIFPYTLPYRLAMNTYLNFVQMLNSSDIEELRVPPSLALGTCNSNKSHIFEDTNQIQKNIVFLLLNNLRTLRERTMEASEQEIQMNFSETKDTVFMTIMIIGVLISSLSIFIVLQQIWITEKNKGEILSLYMILTMTEIENVYQKCSIYLDNLYEQGQSKQQMQANEGDLIAPLNQSISKDKSQKQIAQNLTYQQNQATPNFIAPGQAQFNEGQPAFYSKGCQQEDQFSQISEEEKEEIAFKQYLSKKRNQQRSKPINIDELNSPQSSRSISKPFAGTYGFSYYKNPNSNQDRMKGLIKETIMQIKQIQDQDQLERYYAKQKKEAENRNKKESNKHHKAKKKFKIAQAFLKGSKKTKRLAKQNPDDSIERDFITEHIDSRIPTTKKEGHKQQPSQNQSMDQTAADDDITKSMSFSDDVCEQEEKQNDQENSVSEKSNENNMQLKQLTGRQNKQMDFEDRKRQFYRSIEKNKNWQFIGSTAFVAFLISVYFAFTYMFHIQQTSQLLVFKSSAPVLFKRYTDLYLAYDFMRERIINNGSLDSYYSAKSVFSPHNIDDFYKERSLEDERIITTLKLSQPAIMAPLIDFLKLTDSEALCDDISGEQNIGVAIEKATVKQNLDQKQNDIRKLSYQQLIQTTIAANIAASKGDLEKIKALNEKGINFNQSDYDKRTPLHVAVGFGHLSVVKYLIEEVKVNVNPIDRWGATPLNEATINSQIAKILQENGAIKGSPQWRVPYQSREVLVPDDQFRLFYAAFFGDVVMMDNLRIIGWNVVGEDYEGMTALHIAAAEGHLEAVKYLINKGADLGIKDARGFDPYDEARRANRTAVSNYMRTVIQENLIRLSVQDFEDGLLSKGIQQTFGTFLKKFADLQLVVNRTSNFSKLLELLNPPYSQMLSSGYKYMGYEESLPVFIATQEIYLHRVVSKQISIWKTTIYNFIDNFFHAAQAGFFVFIAFLMVLLFVLRRKLITMMRDDVHQSRGILNLIPESFFEDNRDSIENLLKKLKD